MQSENIYTENSAPQGPAAASGKPGASRRKGLAPLGAAQRPRRRALGDITNRAAGGSYNDVKGKSKKVNGTSARALPRDSHGRIEEPEYIPVFDGIRVREKEYVPPTINLYRYDEFGPPVAKQEQRKERTERPVHEALFNMQEMPVSRPIEVADNHPLFDDSLIDTSSAVQTFNGDELLLLDDCQELTLA